MIKDQQQVLDYQHPFTETTELSRLAQEVSTVVIEVKAQWGQEETNLSFHPIIICRVT